MIFTKIPRLKIGNLTVEVPIIQGGMGVGISLSGLASASSNEGCLGVIAANAIGMLEPDYEKNGKEANLRALRKEIRKARTATFGPVGVNIMVATDDFNDFLSVSIEEKVDIVILGAGLPIKGIPVEELRKANIKVLPIVSSARAANLIFKSWQKKYKDIPDGVIVEGPKAGGHLGFKVEQINDPDYSLEKIVPEVISALKVFEEKFDRSLPVIAAGGVFNGEDIYTFLKMGAKGVQMGTRFVATEECDADHRFKEAYVSCREEDITLIKSPVGLPGRAIKNSFLEDIDKGVKKLFKCPWRCLQSCDAKNAHYCISMALDNARKGILDKGFAFAGSNAPKISEIVTVKQLVSSLKEEYLATARQATGSIREEYEKALEKLRILRDEYAESMDNSVAALRADYERVVDKGMMTIREEYEKALVKMENLKDEYVSTKEKAQALRTQLSEIFDSSSLLHSLSS